MAEKISRCCCILVTVGAPKKVFVDPGRLSQRTILLRASDSLALRKSHNGGANLSRHPRIVKRRGEKKRT
ncbi:MAG: hypothetical protein ABIQ08_16140 [Duganella sp.]